MRVCNTCDGTGVVKNLHNWATGGKRDQACWNCHEVEVQQPAPSAAAAQQSAACDKAPAGWLCIRQHGHDGPCAVEPTLSARSDEWVEGYAAGVRDGRKDALRTQQPAPAIPDTEAFQNFHRLLCARFGYVHDERDWRRDQLSLVEHIARQAQPSPTPQADSQPVPEYVGNGMFKGETIKKAAEHWANWCDRRCMTGLAEFLRVVAATPAFWTPEEIAAAKERAKKFEPWLADTDRAARAPADSVTAPAGGVDDAVDAIALARYKVVPAHESMFHRFAVVAGDGKQQLYLGREVECENMARKFAGAFLDGAFYQSNIAPTPPAQAADSVLEDAARLDHLQRTGSTVEVLPGVEFGDAWRYRVGGLHKAVNHDIRAAIDAARKQGANHD